MFADIYLIGMQYGMAILCSIVLLIFVVILIKTTKDYACGLECVSFDNEDPFTSLWMSDEYTFNIPYLILLWVAATFAACIISLSWVVSVPLLIIWVGVMYSRRVHLERKEVFDRLKRKL